MKHAVWIMEFAMLYSLISFSQDSTCIVQRGQILKYRKGYLVTSKNDTIQGLIYHESDDRIYFIRKGIKIKTTLLGTCSSISFITAGSDSIKAFYRNGIFYETRNIPPENKPVFLSVLERGPINLYYLIYNYSDKQLSDQMVEGGLTYAANNPVKTEEEYYDVKDYYIQKNPDPHLILIPRREKKFQDVFIPLIRDNKVFVKELYGQPVNYYHLHEFVKRYNSTIGKN